ncbi:hypothetical protein J2S09_000727 [Bacillus fengqiuensis]|nr:hypothetical protein [Bacillus fengqiuensis]
MDNEREESKIKTDLRVGRSLGDHEHIEPSKKGILKALIPIIIVGGIVLISFLKN